MLGLAGLVVMVAGMVVVFASPALPLPAQVLVTIVSANPSFTVTYYVPCVTAPAGKPFTVNLTVANTGTGTGTAEIRLYGPAGALVNSTQIALAPGTSQNVTLDATTPEAPGTYAYKVEVYNLHTLAVDCAMNVTVKVVARTLRGGANVLDAGGLPEVWMVAVFLAGALGCALSRLE